MERYAGVIVRSKNKVLLCKRNTKKSLPGFWSIPAGKVEKGETPKETAYREFLEETDLQINGDIEFVSVIKRFTRDGTKVKGMMYCYLLDSDNEIYPDLKNAEDGDEHTECGYFDKKNLPTPITEQLNKILNIILK
jgi:ADP-ribose pyrophosphatase YjhB (NUDIX family)